MKNPIIVFAIFALAGLGMTACNDENARTEEMTENADMDEEITAGLDDETSMQPYTKPEAAERTTDGQNKQDKFSTDRLANSKAKATSTSAKAFYMANEVDTPPLFNEKCAMAADPMQCSYEELTAYIQTNLEYPDAAKRWGNEGVEKITFIVNEDGRINSEMVIQSMNPDCKGCAEAVREIVREMPAWKPATKDGKPVKVQLTLPVKFQLEEI